MRNKQGEISKDRVTDTGQYDRSMADESREPWMELPFQGQVPEIIQRLCDDLFCLEPAPDLIRKIFSNLV
jgi:hypothetical protein